MVYMFVIVVASDNDSAPLHGIETVTSARVAPPAKEKQVLLRRVSLSICNVVLCTGSGLVGTTPCYSRPDVIKTIL